MCYYKKFLKNIQEKVIVIVLWITRIFYYNIC
jgi:hypothetical protein